MYMTCMVYAVFGLSTAGCISFTSCVQEAQYLWQHGTVSAGTGMGWMCGALEHGMGCLDPSTMQARPQPLRKPHQVHTVEGSAPPWPAIELQKLPLPEAHQQVLALMRAVESSLSCSKLLAAKRCMRQHTSFCYGHVHFMMVDRQSVFRSCCLNANRRRAQSAATSS